MNISDISIPDEKQPVRVYRDYLKKMGLTYSFVGRERYTERMKLFRDVVHFPWREDQHHMIESFLRQEYTYYVLNAVFGSGKTTLLMGIHLHAMMLSLYTSSEAMFISFNVCIRNELKQKLRLYGSSSTEVRTFDSIIYEICKIYHYPHLDLPNFEGKRKFVYKICKEIECEETVRKALSVSPKYIFIDECQDLEHQTIILFQTFFPQSQIIFVGDVFQSIQKEPRESLLWYLLHTEEEISSKISRYYMKETPRVPDPILNSVKQSLIQYYPEFQNEIQDWRSSNHSSNAETNVEWHRFYNYADIFKEMDKFLASHPPEQSMILTFSSAITVKGAMGDLARIRAYLCGKGHAVNKNHKKMDYDKLFLSTVNSSKGLERDYIFIVSTFPLERAFMNFSNDLVINLITVGMTRAKKKVMFYVPAYKDKFSRTLEYYFDCPKPNKEKIRDGKVMDELTFGDYLHLEHSVTEIIKQNMIKYDTRIKLREFIKPFETQKLFEENIPAPKIDTEEERSFVGILIENLITSSWVNKWPVLDDIERLRNHPMYAHCFKKIEQRLQTYMNYVGKNECNEQNQFQGIYYYSQIHVAMYNKLFVDLSANTLEYLKKYWKNLRPKAIIMKPQEGKVSVQCNMRMPWMTGISDVMILKKGEEKNENENDEENENNKYKKEEVTIWELKASVDVNWKEDALIQAALYGVMTGKTWCRLVLLNPFRNEKKSYYFNMKSIMQLREWVINDVMAWNVNCFMSKQSKVKGASLDVTNHLFLSVGKHQQSLYQFMSPTKIDLVCNYYTNCENSSKKRKDMTKLEKLCVDSDKNKDKNQDEKEDIFSILSSPQYRHQKLYYLFEEGCGKEEMKEYISHISQRDAETIDVLVMTGKREFSDFLNELQYTKNEDLKYEADFSDTLTRGMIVGCYLAKEFKLI